MRAIVRTLSVLVSVAALVPSSVSVGSPAAAPPPRDVWSGEATFVSGTSTYDDGEWIHTDFLYDDDGRARNGADIVEFRAARSADGLRVRVTLNSMVPSSETAVVVAVGDGPVTAWPGGAGVRSRLERAIVVTTAGSCLPARSCFGAVRVDRDDNTLEARLAAGESDAPFVNVGAGPWDAAAGAFAEAVADLAFTKGPPPADATSARRTFGRPQGDPAAPGLHERVYRTVQSLGEGYGGSFPRFRGLYQPYAVWVPRNGRAGGAPPLLLLLHSLHQVHTQYAAYGGLYERLGDDLGAVVVTPLALGTDGWYWDEALVDTLQVWDEARRAYGTDDDRTWIAGYSMGGYGAYKLASMFPGRFAGLVSWGGLASYELDAPLGPLPHPGRADRGDIHDQAENLRSVPTFVLHAAGDEVVPVARARAWTRVLRSLGGDRAAWFEPGAHHLVFAERGDFTAERDWLSGRRRSGVPDRVRFVVDEAAWATASRPEAERRALLEGVRAAGFDPSGAWWVSGLTVAPGAGRALVDLRIERTDGRAVLRGSLTGVASISVDPDLAGLDETASIELDADGPVDLRLGRVVRRL